MMTTLLIAANSTQLDPGFFQEVKKRKEKNVKDKLMGYLTTACITSGIGVLLFYMEDKSVKEIAAPLTLLPLLLSRRKRTILY